MSIESDHIKFNQINDLLDDRLSSKEMHSLIDQMLESKHGDVTNECNQLKGIFKQLTVMRHVISSVAENNKMAIVKNSPIDISQLVAKKIKEQSSNNKATLKKNLTQENTSIKNSKSYSFLKHQKVPLAIAASILLLLFNLPFLQQNTAPVIDKASLQIANIKQGLPAEINSQKNSPELAKSSNIMLEVDNNIHGDNLLRKQQVASSEQQNIENSVLLQYLEQQSLKQQQFDAVNFYSKVSVSPYADLIHKVNSKNP